ncbi:acyltransferase [Rhizobium jaguaris]|uniref:Acyltransferase n=1 Tax=Rhizobium jaguaris TaxID=1312183 RepID=A0A387FYW1_9HYPH|nr:acyltransferase [Rhizobium jaguaris]AYG62415.1 acyltransferase [Rhizobium jaguaris]
MNAAMPKVIRDIQVLRAIAITLAIFSHLSWLKIAWYSQLNKNFNPWVGVDLFFAISGFVIGRELLEMKSRNERKAAFFSAFWIKRVFRILPSAWFWATFALAATMAPYVFDGAGYLAGTLPEYGWMMLQIGNVHYAMCTPTCGGGSVFYTAYWSLGLEEQFYLVLPFVVWFSGRNTLVGILFGVIALQFFVGRPHDPPNALWYFRADALAWGVLIAIAANEANFQLPKQRIMYVIAGAILIAAMTVVPSTGLGMSTALVAVFAAGLVYIGSRNRNYFEAGRLSPIVQWLGARSFGLYLVHLPAIGLTHWIMTNPLAGAEPYDALSLLPLVIASALAGCAAEFNYRLLERPLRKVGRRIAQRIET